MENRNDTEARMYASEREDNFRWLSRLAATRSTVTLTDGQLASDETVTMLSEFGEFAEITHGSINPQLVFSKREQLTRPGYPLEHYRALKDETPDLITVFEGSAGNLQGMVVWRAHHDQIIVSFSGTSNVKLAILDIWAWAVKWQPCARLISAQCPEYRVHSGFSKIYEGVRRQAFEGLKSAIVKRSNDDHPPTIVLTAHSLGAAITYLMLIELFFAQIYYQGPDTKEDLIPKLPRGTRIIIASFGPPRLANPQLAAKYRELVREYRRMNGEDSFEEYPVIADQDGVPAMPTRGLGYVHLFKRSFYLYHGKLYHVPESESEHALFNVDPALKEGGFHPRGGHNYYNGRDMERLQRRMKAIAVDIEKEKMKCGRKSSEPAASNLEPWMRKYEQREKDEDDEWQAKQSAVVSNVLTKWKRLVKRSNSM